MEKSHSESLAAAEKELENRPLNERLTKKMSEHRVQVAVIGAAVLVFGTFMVLSPAVFLRPRIYVAFLSTAPFFGIMALGLTLILVSKQIDLSFPSTMALGAFVSASIFAATDSLLLGMLGGMLVGAAVGVLNGILVTKVGIPSIIATLGMMFALRGAVHVLSDGMSISLTALSGSPLRNVFVGMSPIGIPAQSLWFIGIAVLLWFLLFRHKFGDHVLFTGDNESAAQMMGVNTDLTKTLVFVILGVLAAFAGVLDSLRMLRWFPTLGEGYLLMTFGAVFVGGTSMFGGAGTIFGTFIGTFLVGSLEAGVIAAGLAGFWTRLFVGVLILVAVTIHALLSRR